MLIWHRCLVRRADDRSQGIRIHTVAATAEQAGGEGQKQDGQMFGKRFHGKRSMHD